MSEDWVVNSSPLIALARIGQTRLLGQLARKAIIPRAVAREIEAGATDDPARLALAAGELEIVESPPLEPELIAWDLGAGETAVLALALQDQRWTAIIDDAQARRCARSLSVPVKGTLAVIILAKQRGFITSAAALLRELRRAGFRLDDRTIRQALAHTTGESWDD
ncbi:MAG: DUF3368 domain-containing protein [Chloroflexi bacterium]|nr:DUF3368 domain-containing protein [Chloroflexota bacterium]